MVFRRCKLSFGYNHLLFLTLSVVFRFRSTLFGGAETSCFSQTEWPPDYAPLSEDEIKRLNGCCVLGMEHETKKVRMRNVAPTMRQLMGICVSQCNNVDCNEEGVHAGVSRLCALHHERCFEYLRRMLGNRSICRSRHFQMQDIVVVLFVRSLLESMTPNDTATHVHLTLICFLCDAASKCHRRFNTLSLPR